jgi:TatD DNase family protein
LRRIAAAMPSSRLLVETDAPYLAPEPYRGKTNQPAYVAHTARVLAEVVGLPVEDLARTTTANFYRLFAKAASADQVPSETALA